MPHPEPPTRTFDLTDLHHLFSDTRIVGAGETTSVLSRAILHTLYFAGLGAVFILAAVGVGQIATIAGAGACDELLIIAIAAVGAASFVVAARMLVWKREFRIDRATGQVVLSERRLRLLGARRSETEVRLDDVHLRIVPASAWLYRGEWRGSVLELEFGIPAHAPLLVRRGSQERMRKAAQELAGSLKIPID